MNNINLNSSQRVKLKYLPNSGFKEAFDGKGWSYSYVYHFTELRDVYLVIKTYGYTNRVEFAKKCRELKLKHVSTLWDEEGRRLLELVNALRNFNLLDSSYQIIDELLFKESKIGGEIANSELLIFKKIFFSYYRFKEMMSWFINPSAANQSEIINSINEQQLRDDSLVLYPLSSTDTKYTDSFILELKDNPTVFYIAPEADESSGGIVRFWDVFIKWAQELNLVEKFNLRNLDYQVASQTTNLTCVYFKRDMPESFSFLRYIRENYRSSYINIPRLIFKLATQHRYSIASVKNRLVTECLSNSDHLALQRTSEIFIRDTEIQFVPIVNDSYVSHILVQ